MTVRVKHGVQSSLSEKYQADAAGSGLGAVERRSGRAVGILRDHIRTCNNQIHLCRQSLKMA